MSETRTSGPNANTTNRRDSVVSNAAKQEAAWRNAQRRYGLLDPRTVRLESEYRRALAQEARAEYERSLQQNGANHPETRHWKTFTEMQANWSTDLTRQQAARTEYERQQANTQSWAGMRPSANSNTGQQATGPYVDSATQRLIRQLRQKQRITTQQAKEMERRAQDDIIAFVSETFAQFGMGDMTNVITDLARQGYGSSEITLRLRQTEQYKQKFGYINDARTKAGLSALSEGEIVDLRDSYRSLLRQAGMPKGFYDSQEDFDRFLINDVSVAELGQRISVADTVVGERVDEATQQAFKQYFGIGKKQLAAYFLDPDRALPLLEKQADMARLGGEALNSGVKGLAGKNFVENLVEKGIDQGMARQAFGQVAEQQDTIEMLGNIEGNRVSTRDQAEGILGIDNNAEQKVRGLKSRERARFSGSGAGTRALGGADAAGSF